MLLTKISIAMNLKNADLTTSKLKKEHSWDVSNAMKFSYIVFRYCDDNLEFRKTICNFQGFGSHFLVKYQLCKNGSLDFQTPKNYQGRHVF